MLEDLKSQILDIASLVKELPENLQLRAFELLVADLLASDSAGGRKPRKTLAEPPEGDAQTEKDDLEDTSEDLQSRDVHAKARKFLEQNQLELADLNELFYKEDGVVRPLYEELGTSKMAESQVRIALLQSLQQAIESGEFAFNKERVRSECQTRKCYDGPNFATNFKNRAALFDAVDKGGNTMQLTNAGRKELAAVVRALK